MSKTCLIVDDSKVIRKVARHMMEGMDFVVDEACDGQEALESCGKFAPDVILLDWNMPIMTGIEFLRALGKSDISPRPKVVFCTTEGGTDFIRTALDAGADEYVMKPFDRETLASKLQFVGLV